MYYPFKQKIISRLNFGYFEGYTNHNAHSTQYYWRMAHKLAFLDVVEQRGYDGAIVMEYVFLLLQLNALWSFMRHVTTERETEDGSALTKEEDTVDNSIFLFNADFQPLHEALWLVTKIGLPDSKKEKSTDTFFERVVMRLMRDMPVKCTCYEADGG